MFSFVLAAVVLWAAVRDSPLGVLLAFMLVSSAVVVLAARPRLLVPATLVALTVATPAGVPSGFGGLLFYEVLLLPTLVYVALRTPPTLRAVRWLSAYAIGIGLGVTVALFSGHEPSRVFADVRFPIALGACYFVAAGTVHHRKVYSVLLAARVSLWISCSLLLLAVFTGLTLSGRSETASLDTSDVASTSAIRYLTMATMFALAVLCAVVVALALGQMRLRAALHYLAPAAVIVFLSFSRNSILALAVSLVFAVVVSNGLRDKRRVVGQVLVKGLVGLLFLLVLVQSGVLRDTAVGENIDAYVDRVVTGLSSDARRTDPSLLYRQSEVQPLWDTFTASPIVGRGFGYAYKAPYGSGFTADDGRYYAHHWYLWLLAKAGVVGMLGFAILVVASLAGCRRSQLGVPLGGAAVGLLTISVVAPVPLGSGAGVLGALLGAVVFQGDAVRSTEARLMHGAGAVDASGFSSPVP